MASWRALAAFAILTPTLLAGVSAAGDVRGRVLVDGAPAAEATVSVLPFEDGFERSRREARGAPEPEPLVSGVTGRDGSFRLTLPPASGPDALPVHLQVSGGALAPRRLARLVDPAGEDLGDVRLAQAAVLAGGVQDEQGGPVVGATVRLWAGRGGRFGDDLTPVQAVPQQATTGHDGTFRFDQAADTGNRIRIEAPGLATVERSGLKGGAVARPVTLELGRVLRGAVTRPDKRTPARGALVRFEGQSTTRWHEVRPDGSFLVEGVPAREGGQILADGGDLGRALEPVEAGATEPVRVVLAPNAVLRGRVVAADTGRALAGVQVVARTRDGASYLGRSDRDGRYAITGLPPRSYTLQVDDERFVSWSRSVDVSPGRTEAQDIPLVLGARLTGRVVSEDGVPVEDATIQVSRTGASRMRDFFRLMRRATETVRTARDGRFEATRLPPGEGQRLDVSHEDYENRSLGGIDLSPGRTTSGVAVALRRGLSLEGVVKDEEGQRVPGVEVQLQRPRTFRGRRGALSASMMGPGDRPRVETGADGRFSFRGLVAGDYTLVASRPGYGRGLLDPVKLLEDGSTEPVEIVLGPGAAISGFLRDGRGEGAAGWYLMARPSGQGGPAFALGAPRTEEPTGPDGLFLLEGLTEGEVYDLQVMGPAGLGPRRAGVTAPTDDVEITVTGHGQIRGRATEAESGQPVVDFEVRFRPDSRGGMRFAFASRGGGRNDRRSFHAEDGAFVLEEVPAGRWTVEVTAEGLQPGTASGITVEEGRTVEGVDIALSKGGTISGEVVEAESGRPILDASVRAELSGGGRQMPRFLGGGRTEATTDADGRYEITGLAPGTWAVTASHSEWSESSVTVELEDAPANADLRLGAGGSLVGVVLAGGRPVAGAEVGLSEAGGTGRGFGGGQGSLTGQDGRFRFDRLAPGRYTLSASLRSQSSDPVEAVVTGETGQEVTLTLEDGAVVHGTVSGLPEVELNGVSVTANGPDGYFASSRTGVDGTFELTGVPEGTISLRATAGSFVDSTRTAQASVTLGPGQPDAYAEVIFEPGIRVEGTVTRSGEPVADAFVTASPETGGGRAASSRTDEWGSFVLEGMSEGSYRFFVTAQGGAPITKTVSLTGDTTVDIEVPPARIAGSVVEAGTGQPLGDVSVRVEEGGGGFRFANQVASDSAGRFAMEDLEPRAYRLTFQKPAYETETREVTADEDTEIRVEMRRGEGLGLVARDRMFGTPLRGLMVRLVDGSGVAVFSGTVPLDSEGRGEIPSVKPGSYELRASSSGYAPLVRPGIMVPSSAVALALTPGGTVEIHAGPETLSMTQAQGRLYGADGRPYLTSIFSTDGLIPLRGPVRRLENVAAGNYTFAVEGGARKEVQIREGGVAVVALP